MFNPVSQSNLNSLLTQTLGATNLFGGIPGSGSNISSITLLSTLSGLQSTSAANQNAVNTRQTFNRSELSLRNTAAALNATNTSSVFNSTGVTSSDTTKVSATALANATAGTFNVKVNQLAQGTQIQGTNYVQASSAQASGLTNAGGFAQMDINVGGVTSTVTTALNGTETNDVALGKIASDINNRVSGVTANVTTDATGNARLNLTGQTGAGNTISVIDVLGNAGAYTGISSPTNVVKTAQNAQFSVNGTAYSTSTNTPTVTAEGLKLNLSSTTGTGSVDITVNGISSAVESGVRDFVSQYNSTLSTLKSNPETYSQQSAVNLQNMVSSNASALKNVGINVSTNGQLSINENTFTQALTTNPSAVTNAFNGGGRLAAGVQAETERAINASLSAPTPGGFASFSGIGSNNYGSSLNSYIVGALGMFFNQTF